MRLLRLVLLFVFINILRCDVATAFFTENYKKNILSGAFKKQHKADLYFNIQAGFLLKTWGPNLNTAVLANSTTWNSYSGSLGTNALNENMSMKYSYSIDANIGLAVHGSRFRHEIGFTWYSIATEPKQLTGLTTTINGTEYNFASINGEYFSKIGAYSNIYKIMYHLFFDIRDVFNLLKTKWDVFIGIGAGFAVMHGGTFYGEKITATQDGENVNYSVLKKNPSSVSADDYHIDRELSFGVGYQISMGMISNLSQSFAASVGLSFEGTSRPLFTNKCKFINSTNGAQINYEYHIALKIGIYLKAVDLML